jgi:hypothetical protein
MAIFGLDATVTAGKRERKRTGKNRALLKKKMKDDRSAKITIDDVITDLLK